MLPFRDFRISEPGWWNLWTNVPGPEKHGREPAARLRAPSGEVSQLSSVRDIILSQQLTPLDSPGGTRPYRIALYLLQ